MAINLKNSVTWTGLNLVTNPILKSSATNPVNIWVKTPVNQYKTEDPRYANKTQVNTQVKTPVTQTTTAPMSVNPKYQTNQTTVPAQTNTNQSRFIWFQNNNLWVQSKFTQDMQNITQGKTNLTDLIKARTENNKNKKYLEIPTQAKAIKQYNQDQEQRYRTNEKAIEDFHYDVLKFNWKMTADQISQYYPEFRGKENQALELQKALLPYVLDNEFASMEAITENFPDLLPAKQQANTTEDEAKATAKKIDSENKKHFDRIKNINQNTLSYNGKEFANFMIELSNVPYQIKKNYKVDSAVTDEEIIAYVLNNFPEYKEEYERIQNLQLSDQDKARLWIWGNWLNKFSVWVANAVNAANNWYQNNVQKTLSDVPIVGSIANIPWSAIGWFNKMLQAWWELTNWEFESAWQIASSWIKAIWGWVESVLNTALAPITAAFNVAWETELWKKVEENTLWLAQDWITAFYEKTPIIKNFYNSLDDEAKADLVNETMLALFHWLGKWIKKTWLDVKAWVATDAITNALQRWKYASKFQIWVEKWLADENGKFSDWALKRIVWEWTKEVESALKENFSRFNEVVEARKQARDFKQAPVDNTNLEDQRSTTEKVKSEIKNTAEAVKEKVKQVNETVKEKYANLNQRRSWNQEQQWQQWFSTTSKTNNWLNQSNFSQKNEQINTKKLNTAQTQLIQNYNRMNPKAIDTFEEKFWENYWQYMYERWFTKAWEDNLKDMVDYQKELMDIKENALNQIEWRFKDQAITDMLDHLLEYYENTKNRKMLAEFSPLKEQLERDWLTMTEANKIRKKYQYDIRTKFYSDWNSEKIELANNIYLAMKDFLDKTAKENWLDSLDEINREIMKVQHIIWWVSYKLRWSSANNTLWLTDYITLASMLNNPAWLAVFLWKQALKTNWVRNFILDKAVGWKWNAKNRITADKMWWEIERIAKINDEKARNKALEKFYNTYIKPVKELSEYFDNSVAEFKKQFNEMVEEWTLDNALPDLRESDVKSGKKNLVTSKNQVTIEADEKGNARRKGQISEVDKRNEDNKKGWYDNKPTEPTEPKKPAPTQPKNSVTSKKAPKTNTSEEHEQKTEKTAHKEEPKKENSYLKAIVWDDYYNWLEKQLEIINDSRKWNKEPLKLEDIDIGSDIYLAKFEKLHREKLKSLQQELADLNINQADTKLTPKQQKMLEQAKSEEERQWLLEKWRREYLEKNQMSDEDIAKVENIMNKAHELVEQREKYYNYILDWTEKKNAKDKVTNTKNAITSKKQETATEFMDRLERENAEDIKAQQSDLFNMPETEDIEAIDKELTAIQQEDLKNMPETEDVESIDAKKTWLAEKLNNTAIDTNSSDFKDWFWDWENDPKNASKVVNEDWTPKVVYHWTPYKQQINVFDKNRAWKTQSADFKWIFFTDEKWIADIFSHEQLPWSSSFFVKLWEKGNLYSTYLNIKNPLDFNQKITKEFAEELYNYRKITPQYWWWLLDYYPWAEWKEKFINQVMNSHPQSIKFLLDMNKVEEAWYDWYIAKMYWWDTPWNEYVVWDSNQIKSATDNVWTFDKNNPDIRFQKTSTKDNSWKELSKWQQEYFKWSKVVDENGNLMRVYHWTNAKYTVYNKKELWSSSWDLWFFWDWWYFATHKWEAWYYWRNVMEWYLDVKNPFYFSELDKIWDKSIRNSEFITLRNLSKLDDSIWKIKYNWYSLKEIWSMVDDYLNDVKIEKLNDSVDNYWDEITYWKVTHDWKSEIYTSVKWFSEDEMLATRLNEYMRDKFWYIKVSDILEDMTSESRFNKDTKSFSQILQDKWYDWIIVWDSASKADEIVVFNSNQFKNIDNLNPTKNEDIRFQQGENIGRSSFTEKSLNKAIENMKKTGLAKDVKTVDTVSDLRKELKWKISKSDLLQVDWEIAWCTTPDWTVYLVKEFLRDDTLKHEFAHRFRSYAEKNNPELFKAINKVAEEAPTELKERIKRDYWELSDDALLDEVFAWKQWEFKVTWAELKWYQKMWKAIEEVWNSIKSKFWKNYADLSAFDWWEKMSSEQIMSKINDILENGKKVWKPKNLVTNKRLREQAVWHGSPADFDKFDSTHMWEWEWAQAHWWGHYVAVEERTWRHYAEMKNPSNYEYKWRWLKDIEKELWDSKPWEKVELIPIKQMLDSDWMSRYQGWERFDEIKKEWLERAKREMESTKEIYEENPEWKLSSWMTYKERYEIDKRLYDAWKNLDKKDFDFEKPSRNLYNVEIPDPKKKDTPTGKNYLEEDGAISKKELEKINNELLKKEWYLDIANNKNLKSVSDMTKEDVENIVNIAKKSDDWTYNKVLQGKELSERRFQTSFFTLWEIFDGQLHWILKPSYYVKLLTEAWFKPDLEFVYWKNWKDVYRSLENVLWSDKQASKFLESIWYDWIHYFWGRDWEAYVIFNDDALKINSHTKYQKTKATWNSKNRVTSK